MGVDVELIRVEQLGTSPRHRRDFEVAVVGDVLFRFAAVLERSQHNGRTPMLDRIDPYGVLELTPAEMTQFIGELDVLVENVQNVGEHRVLDAIRGLAGRCLVDSDLRLRFVGD
ncbi:hypothetical protein DLE60_16660 [Micromonospora globispora]|uniref:Uncharacterized protein n=2 Tax=Micromonospora globispora TaxID=1450148 RepID=A0A317K0R7_9ACTN|nr:hypothetical protein [Micromonospora globispora]PWU46268.1 hypothetical protein DLJ46_18660 [Micromonospora globispora]PWU59411.1 hypothetical protein DLE60_16660 [Micromonospora globispora]RQW93042.1 hypothetical protein DKL51_18005 [Micromonospora globispora]